MFLVPKTLSIHAVYVLSVTTRLSEFDGKPQCFPCRFRYHIALPSCYTFFEKERRIFLKIEALMYNQGRLLVSRVSHLRIIPLSGSCTKQFYNTHDLMFVWSDTALKGLTNVRIEFVDILYIHSLRRQRLQISDIIRQT